MKTRIISAVCMLPLLIVLYFGGIPLLVAAALIAMIGADEFTKGFQALGVRPSRKIVFLMGIILYGVHLLIGFQPMLLLGWIVLSVAVSMIYGWDIKNRGPYDALATMITILYVLLFPYHIVLIDNSDYSIMVWMVIIAAFAADIMAYFTGMAFGKHKLCPNLSPKKTVEGAVGGLLGSGIAAGIFGYFFLTEHLAESIAIGIFGGLVSMAGDLTASAFKRQMGIKDYGKLIPGHGGILDRFDSVIFVAPAIYYFIIFILP